MSLCSPAPQPTGIRDRDDAMHTCTLPQDTLEPSDSGQNAHASCRCRRRSAHLVTAGVLRQRPCLSTSRRHAVPTPPLPLHRLYYYYYYYYIFFFKLYYLLYINNYSWPSPPLHSQIPIITVFLNSLPCSCLLQFRVRLVLCCVGLPRSGAPSRPIEGERQQWRRAG